MAKMQFITEKYPDLKKMFGRVRKIAKDFIDSDMQGSAMMRLLRAILDNREDFERKGKQFVADANQAIRDRKVWKIAFRMNRTKCNN